MTFLAHNLPVIMLATLIVAALAGYPLAFALTGVGLMFYCIGVWLAPFSGCVEINAVCPGAMGSSISLDWPLLAALPIRVFEVISNDSLFVIPFLGFVYFAVETARIYGEMKWRITFPLVFMAATSSAVGLFISIGYDLPISVTSVGIVAAALALALYRNRPSHGGYGDMLIAWAPALLVVALTFGGVLAGLFTIAEGATVSAICVAVLALVARRLDLASLARSITATIHFSIAVVATLVGLRIFALTFFGVNGTAWIEHYAPGLMEQLLF